MKVVSLNLVAAAVLHACYAEQTPGTLQFIMARSERPLLEKRDATISSYIGNNHFEYLINITVGTPPQSFSLQLDTGSSDLWLPASNLSACELGQCPLGAYDMAASSTAQEYLSRAFMIRYADNSTASGDLITDDVQLEGATLSNLVVGVAYETPRTTGLMGIGYTLLESYGLKADTVAEDMSRAYPNVPAALFLHNVTNTVAYSLWLNDLEASTGNILFGGIDTAKYQGDLIVIDLVPQEFHGDKVYNEFYVTLSGFQAVSDSGSDMPGTSSLPVQALLDCGATATFLPDDLVAEIYDKVGGELHHDNGYISCDMATSTSYFSFALGGPTSGAIVNVSMSEIVDTLATGANERGEKVCVFNIKPASFAGGRVTLGDSFLRSAYVVYDLVNNQTAIAQTKFNATDSNVIAFSSYGAPVPTPTYTPDNGNATALNGSEATATSTSLPAASGSTGPASDAVALRTHTNGLLGVITVLMLAMTSGFVTFLL